MRKFKFANLEELNATIIDCVKCPRLVEHREHVEKKQQFSNEKYWRKPVPGFGDRNGWLLIAGLAPSSHGGNRTGRIFTGDQTSNFLFENLFEAGFSNQPKSTGADDGLRLKNCYITAAVKCAPPNDNPSAQERKNCNPYLQNEIFLLKNLTHILTLGRIGFKALIEAMHDLDMPIKDQEFEHGKKYLFENTSLIAYASYHPSPQNVNTGRLSKKEFLRLLEKLKKEYEA